MNKITKVMLTSFFTNIFLSLIKIITGLLGHAGALVADGFHSLSDTITDIFAIIGSKISNKPADKEHPLGHGKAEYVTCAFIGLIILFMGCFIIYSSLFDDRTIPSMFVATVTLITIFLKLLLSKFLLYKGKVYQSSILTASGKESFSDVLSSFIVLVSVLLAQFADKYSIFMYADAVAMFVVGLLILKIAYSVLKESISNLLDEQVTDTEYINKIQSIINKHEEVKNIDRLIIIKEGPFYKIDIEVSMDKNMKLSQSHNIVENIETEIKNFDNKIKYIIIHTNPYEKTIY